MQLPPLQPRSRRAHEAAHWARQQGRFDDFNAQIFRAFFERGQDISDIDLLATLATRLQMDGKQLREVLEQRTFEPSVIADEEEARRLDLQGVPAFVADRYAAISGVQPVDNLRLLIEKARAHATSVGRS